MVFRDGRRRTDHFISARWLALDFDSPEYPLAQALNEWCDTTHLIGTTKSHQRTKGDKPPCDRFRLLVPFDREITSIDEYVYNYDLMVERYGADSQAKDPARLFFPCEAIASTETSGLLQPVRLVPEGVTTYSHREAAFQERTEHYRDAKIIPSWLRARLDTEIPFGKRNNAIYGLAKDLTGFGLAPEKIYSLVLASRTYAGQSISPSLAQEIRAAITSGAKGGFPRDRRD